jgi:hypothetical protein
MPVRHAQAVLSAVATATVTAEGQIQVGAAVLSATGAITVAGIIPVPPTPPGFTDLLDDMPSVQVAIAFDNSIATGGYAGVSEYTRSISSKRWRQFELDRVEAGQADAILSNNDSRFNPENTSSPYYPNIVPTRPVRWQAYWNGTSYDIFHGYLEGYPVEFPHTGADSLVKQHAVDETMRLALSKFVPGSTTLTTALIATTEAVEEVIGVGGSALPMPQAVPFTIQIGAEAMSVTEIVSGTEYRVSRQAGEIAHTAGAAVTTTAVSFGEEYSGTRIQRVLERIGVVSTGYDLDAGQTLLAPSSDLAGQAPVEHLTFVAEVEGGRLFISRAGKVTFHDRHHIFKNELASRATFGDAGDGAELPYQNVEVTHEHERIYNVVRITPASGNVVEVRDAASIALHFERVLEKQWPLANDNEATAAANYLLARYSTMQVRIPSLVVNGRSAPALMWPHLLALEMGQRFRLIRRVPGTDIDKQLVVEGVEHSLSPANMPTRIQLSLADSTHYWRLGVATYGELGVATRTAY